MKQFFCELLFICTAASPGAMPIEDLAYGTVLYEYYQEDYQGALLNVLVAEARAHTGDDPIRFELAKGSFAFADGMYDYAQRTFERVPDGELTELDRMRLAFHLSREYHRRQDWHGLGEALAGIDLGESWLGKERTHPEVEFMRAEHAISQKDFPRAEAAFARIAPTSPLQAYGAYNLGVAYREAGLVDEAMRTFRGLAGTPAFTREAFDLGQRAKVALALLARDKQNHTGAEQVLGDLPAHGRYQDVAMAAYGGLAMDTGDFELAARIWMTLQAQEYWTPSTATARIGFPLSLERMALEENRASADLALLEYKKAEDSFTQRLASLRALMVAAQDPEWVRGLLQVFARPVEFDEDGRVREAQQLQMQALMHRWQEQLGHTDWLEWLATEEIHQALVQWRDLGVMHGWLLGLPDHLAALREVTEERRRRGFLARQMLVDDGVVSARAELREQITALEDRLAHLAALTPERTLNWMYPLATPDERERLEEFTRMTGLLEHMHTGERSEWSSRIERLQGLIFYQIADEQSKRERVLHKRLRDLRAELADIDAKLVRIGTAEGRFTAGVGADFNRFEARATDLLAIVGAAQNDREMLLSREIRRRMRNEMQRTEKYLLVARIAIARATDHLAMRDMDEAQ